MLIENRNRIFKVVDFDYSPGYHGTEWEDGEDENLSITELKVKFKGEFVNVGLANLDLSRFIELEEKALEMYKASLEPDYDSMREGK